MMRLKTLAIVGVMVTGMLVWTGSASAAIVFFDDTFTSADWSVAIMTFGNGGTVTPSQQLAGGNPGAYRKIDHTVNAAPGPGQRSHLLGFHQYLVSTYDPATLGSITSLDYAEDAILLSGGGAGQATGPALLQNGNVYIRQGLITPEFNWTAKSLTGLVQNDFELVQMTDFVLTDPSQHPDFSASGGTISFGFSRRNSTGLGGGGGSISAGIDNWSITVTQAPVIPEPSSLLLLGTGLLGLAGGRRRRSNDRAWPFD